MVDGGLMLLWNFVAFLKIWFCFVLFCYSTNHLISGPLGNNIFFHESQCFPRQSGGKH